MSERYWDEQVETLPVERRRLLLDHRLRWQVRRCWDGSPFYRARLEAAGLDLATFNGLADWQHLPVLRPDDLPRAPDPGEPARDWTVAPEGWWQERERSGDGLVRILTDGDVTQRAHRIARAAWAAGVRPGRSLAAMAAAPPPSTALSIPVVGPVVGYACGEWDGFHWSGDQYLIEIVDPVTERHLTHGSTGAVVVTDLAREGSPLLRFWTGIEAVLVDPPCACGRTSARSPYVRPLTRG
jgi:phenylacetate-coenzyme A ligase PaaK-like adenylate-forming protein